MHWTDRVGHRLKLRDMHILLAVVQAGSMTKAASLLSVSHPVISKCISELERTLGVKLLHRTPLGIELTQYGRVLAKRSLVVFDELRQTVGELAFLSDPSVGELSVGASEPVAAGLLPVAMSRLLERHPRVRFNIEQGDALSLQRRELRERKIEFVVARMLDSVAEPDMSAEVLFHEKIVAVVGIHSKWASRRKIALEELHHERWILAPLETLPDAPLVEAFGALGLPLPSAVVQVYSIPMRMHLLANGDFLTLVPGSVLRFLGKQMNFKALPVELPKWRLPIAIVTLKNRELSPLAQRFIEMVRAVAKPLAST
jgi:DNA-binding transcriptional LysR family regulator